MSELKRGKEFRGLHWIFNHPNKFYMLLCLPILLLACWQYHEQSYISAMFQAGMFGVILNSWMFSRLQKYQHEQVRQLHADNFRLATDALNRTTKGSNDKQTNE